MKISTVMRKTVLKTTGELNSKAYNLTKVNHTASTTLRPIYDPGGGFIAIRSNEKRPGATPGGFKFATSYLAIYL